MVAKTFQGLEEILAQELLALGARNVEIGQRMVSFEGDLETMYKANLCCRTALRILKPIAKFTAVDPDDLYDEVRSFDWDKYMTVSDTFAVDTTSSSSIFTHSKYTTYRVKDAIADYFREKTGRRPSVSVDNPDRMFNVHVFEDRVTISLDSSGQPLSHRGYKVDNTEAPINEVLAAGIILMTGWRGDVDFADPMCGSGTFLTEAAMIAANINPGIYRENFAFEKWADFDRDLFESIYNDDSAEREVRVRITGGDKSAEAVAIAKRNIKNARLDDIVTVERKDIEEWDENGEEGILVTNPPYGKRLRPGDMDSLWKMIGRCFKNNFKGWHAWVIGLDDEQFAEIGLKPSFKTPLYNGPLECQLREYVMFAGRYDAFRADGGSVHRDKEEDHVEITRGRHLSDREWREETRKFGGDKKKQKFGNQDKPRKFRQERDEKPNRGKGYAAKSKGERYQRDDRHSFNRDRRRDYNRDQHTPHRDFDYDERQPRRDFNRDDRKPFGGNERRRYPAPTKPLTEYKETSFGPGNMRGRRRKPTDTPDED